jgi:hypothetical protein
MITKITITQKKSKTPSGYDTVNVEVSIKQNPVSGDLSKLETAKLIATALQMIMEHPTNNEQKP